MIMWSRFVFSETEITTTAATTATITSCRNTANDETCLQISNRIFNKANYFGFA